jgi:hypothetical protein
LRETNCDLGTGALRAMSVQAKAMMRIMLGTFIHVDPPIPHAEPWDSLADQDDAPIWAAAVASHAQYVVSEDRRHYPPQDSDGRHRHQGVEYLSFQDFKRLLLGEEPNVDDIAVEQASDQPERPG